MTPEQTRATEYLRRSGTHAPVADVRRKVAETFRELDELVATIPEEVVRIRPRPGRWCVQEVVDHLIESHRPAGDELAVLLQGRVPEGEPIPAHLQSPTRWGMPGRSAPFWQSWGKKKRSDRRKIVAPEFGLKEVW